MSPEVLLFCQSLATGPSRKKSTSSLLFLRTSSCSQEHAFPQPQPCCHTLFKGEAGATPHATNLPSCLALSFHSPPSPGPAREFWSSSGMLTPGPVLPECPLCSRVAALTSVLWDNSIRRQARPLLIPAPSTFSRCTKGFPQLPCCHCHGELLPHASSFYLSDGVG